MVRRGVHYELALIPIVTGLIGWVTNIVAVAMLFRPLERRGRGLLSWQGVLPAHAAPMARICVQLLTGRLLDPKRLFAKIDATRVAEILGPSLERHAEHIVEDVLRTRHPRFWEVLPRRVRERARERLRAEIPRVVDELMEELKLDLERYLDVEGLVVGTFLRDKALLGQMFWGCGRNEFLFIAHSGLLFGTLLGLGQAAVWALVQPSWFLPLTGIVVGWATNWLALKMVFEPLEVKQVGPMEWQGLFLRRQEEVSVAYSGFFAERILYPEALVDAVLHGAAAPQLLKAVERAVAHAVDHAAGPAKPLAQLAVGSETWVALKSDIASHLADRIPEELRRVHDYAGETLDIRGELERSLMSLPPADFEQVLRPIFKERETMLIAVGAALGGVAGCVQWLLVTLI